MSEDGNANVNMEEYNKVVAQANSAKVENEELKKQIEESNKAKEIEGKKTETEQMDAQKKQWEEEKIKLQQEKQEMEKKIEEYKTNSGVANPKGLVQDNTEQVQQTPVQIKEMLDQRYPKKEVNAEMLNPIRRLAHYNNPATQIYDKQAFGELLSLQNEFSKGQIPQFATRDYPGAETLKLDKR